MTGIEQVLNYVKNITETLNQWSANAKKTEELPVMETMVAEGLLIVSQLVDGIWTSKQLEIQKIIEGISLSGQDNTVREVLLGTITTVQDLNYLLDNTGITVTENEIIVLTALANVNATLIQRQFLWKLGKGAYNPIGSENSNTKLFELQPRFLSEITADELTSSPSAIVYDFGVITDSILDVINATDPAYNYTDDEKIYYIRFIKDEVKLLYNFIGINGTYGFGASQMTASDLVLVYSSANTDITELFVTKRESQDYLINYFDAVVEEVYLSDERASLSFIGSNTDIKSIRLSEEFMRLGKLFTFKNRQTIPITFWHNSGTGNVKLLFPNEENFVLNPNEIIQFSLNINDSSTPKLEYIGVSGSGVELPIAITDVTGLTAELDSKLDASDYNQHFKGVYLTEAALFSAHTTASVGDYAQVNEVGATDVVNYNWDSEESIWVKNEVAGSGATNTDELPEGTTNVYFTVTRFLANLTYANVIAALGFTPSTAPNNAQKNSDITKAEIEAKLTGEISTHTHLKNDVISYALSGATGNLVVGDVDTFHAPYNFILVSYWTGVKTPPTISSLLVDIKKNGVSITSTKAGIDATEFTSLTGTSPVLTTTTFTKGDVITPVISQIGSGNTGISLKIYLEVIKT